MKEIVQENPNIRFRELKTFLVQKFEITRGSER